MFAYTRECGDYLRVADDVNGSHDEPHTVLVISIEEPHVEEKGPTLNQRIKYTEREWVVLTIVCERIRFAIVDCVSW